MRGKEKHENREFNLLVSKTKYFPLLNWSSQIKKNLISFRSQSCQEDVSVWCSIKVLDQKAFGVR